MQRRFENIIIAPDSFKGSLSSMQVARSIERGVKSVAPQIKTHKCYIADGGEGSVTALVESLGGEYGNIEVHDPLMRPTTAQYGVINGGRKAIIEMAAASGLTLLSPCEYNPLITTTYGVGEMITDALDIGCREFIICIGGSATNDAGTGMLRALGFRFLDSNGCEVADGGGSLTSISTIDLKSVDRRLESCSFEIACDVKNPLYGSMGAAHIFAAQKGANEEMIERLDSGLREFANVVLTATNIDLQKISGSGAAGGSGGAFAAFLNGKLRSGVDIILEALEFDKLLPSADLVITGEGKLDRQTTMGKAPQGVLRVAKEHNVPVIAIGGSVEDLDTLRREGFAAIYPITEEPIELELAMDAKIAQANIEKTVAKIIQMR